jgi:sulfite exporter TauE/SafE
MALFGLGTAPALLAVGLGWAGLSVRFRSLASRAAGPLLIAFGIVTLLRGASLMGAETAAAAALPECCTEDPAPGAP